ncbi:MAG: cupredoxin domain-containing protein [Candidatus Nitrosopumilus sp. bin_7KS]
MKFRSMKIPILTIVFSILLVSFTVNDAAAESVPEWVKNNALWYGQGDISELEFLNAIKFLIDTGVIILDTMGVSEMTETMIVIPNGNSNVSGSGFYLPLNLEIKTNTKVIWVNEDSVPHNIQSQDEFGKVSDMFNSPPLNTGERFEYTFDEAGAYNYYCSFHPWRVGIVTVK